MPDYKVTLFGDDDDDLRVAIRAYHSRLVRTEKKKKDEETARQHNQDTLKWLLERRKYYDTFYDFRFFLMQILKFLGHVVVVGTQLLPPLNTVIKGFSTLLSLVEIIFLSTETIQTKAIRVSHAIVTTAIGIISFALTLSAVTLVGPILVAVGSCVNLAKEIYFCYRAYRDLEEAEQNLARIQTNPHASETALKAAEDTVTKMKASKNEAKKSTFFGALACIGTICLTVALLCIPPVAFIVSISAVAVLAGAACYNFYTRHCKVFFGKLFNKKTDASPAIPQSSIPTGIKLTQAQELSHPAKIIAENKSTQPVKPHEATETIAHLLTPNTKDEIALLKELTHSAPTGVEPPIANEPKKPVERDKPIVIPTPQAKPNHISSVLKDYRAADLDQKSEGTYLTKHL